MTKREFIIKEYPEKSWSISRVKTIKSCLREYYYTYYGSHRGWDPEASYEQKYSWRLKKLTNIWLAFGDVIHKAIKNIIDFKKNNIDKEIDVDALKEFVRTNLNIIVKQSSRKDSILRWNEYPKGNMLLEYYYDGKLEREDILEIKERIEQCVENIFESKTFFDINKGEYLDILEVDEGNFDYFFHEGVKVFALIDLLYLDNDRNIVIVDWKTGKQNEEDREQLLVYLLYVMEKYNVPVEKVKGRVEYLLQGEHVEYSFTNEDVEHIKNRISLEINVINALLVDENNNIPKDKDIFIMCNEDFKCNKCKYRRLCKKERVIRDEIT
ncbi:MAG: PD-(D/E)XK nuclease family protein [Clostridium baratii]|uniref:PD-(D/E)XK nuclease family protein n=1 Tax=Clostridium baratii TaxID=1561 RepID=UPI00242AA4A1|nr:PD-(D/E)XK nuclease family protein [Clostridium baratii]MBS6041741.1 PD-(D/E)XK nuclease family protein [Clostridium baratii]